MKRFTPIILALSFYSVAGICDEATTECKEIQLDQTNFYTVEHIKNDQSISNIYQKKIEKLTLFAKQNQLQKFKITSQDVSLNMGNYNSSETELSISLSFQYLADYQVIDKLRNEFNPGSMSSSRITTCE